jgi:hypothetical protein
LCEVVLGKGRAWVALPLVFYSSALIKGPRESLDFLASSNGLVQAVTSCKLSKKTA